MKKSSNFGLVLLFIITLVFPNQSLLAAPNTNSTQELNKISQPQVAIQVVKSPNLTQLVINNQANSMQLAASCQKPVGESFDLIQDPALINLNQPANCFSPLAVHINLAMERKLAVESLAPVQIQLVVKVNYPVVSSPNLASADPFAQNRPVLPLTFFALGISYIFWEKNRSKQNLRPHLSFVKSGLGLGQLQVLRC